MFRAYYTFEKLKVKVFSIFYLRSFLTIFETPGANPGTNPAIFVPGICVPSLKIPWDPSTITHSEIYDNREKNHFDILNH